MAVGDAHVFPGLKSHTSTNTNFFPKPPTTFLTCFSRGKRRKHAGKKFRLNRVSNSQPSGHESDMHATEPPGPVATLSKSKALANEKFTFIKKLETSL